MNVERYPSLLLYLSVCQFYCPIITEQRVLRVSEAEECVTFYGEEDGVLVLQREGQRRPAPPHVVNPLGNLQRLTAEKEDCQHALIASPAADTQPKHVEGDAALALDEKEVGVVGPRLESDLNVLKRNVWLAPAELVHGLAQNGEDDDLFRHVGALGPLHDSAPFHDVTFKVVHLLNSHTTGRVDKLLFRLLA